MAFRSSFVGGDSPAAKRDKFDADYSNFQPGYRADPVLMSIPECAKEILLAGTKFYLPLQYLSDEVLQAEESSSVIMRPGDVEGARRIVVAVDETTMTTDQYASWSRRHLRAMEALNIRAEWVAMFNSHYTNIITASDWKTAWPRYRAYDIRQRRRARGEFPEDISAFDRTLFDTFTSQAANQVLIDLEEALARTKSGPSRQRDAPSRAGSSSKQHAASTRVSSTTGRTSKDTSLAKFVFDRCWVCGGAHTFKFDVPLAQRCTPRYLVHDAAEDVYRIPASGALVCWGYNCKTGCRRKACRQAHCCALCGAAHSSSSCSR